MTTETNTKKKTKKWLGTWPANCDFCHTDLATTKTFFDARLETGQWALLCPVCFDLYGIGIGLGRGQEYDSETREKIHG